jgi:septal ring factor EnvC (AmiA/AmiB activator)
MDPLSITSSLIPAAKLAGKVLVAIDAVDVPKELKTSLSRIRADVAALQMLLDILAQDIMQADRTMLSSQTQTIAVIQPALMDLTHTLQKLYKTLKYPRTPLGAAFIRSQIREIGQGLETQRTSLTNLVSLIGLRIQLEGVGTGGGHLKDESTR